MGKSGVQTDHPGANSDYMGRILYSRYSSMMIESLRQDGNQSKGGWWQQPVHPATVSRGVITAILVGTVLTVINQGDILSGGMITASIWVKILLNYSVPFLVLLYADLKTRTRAQRNQNQQ